MVRDVSPPDSSTLPSHSGRKGVVFGLNSRSILFIMIAAAALRAGVLLMLLFSPFEPLERLALGNDAIGYSQLATNLLEHGELRFDGGEPTAFRMPGYPAFLAFFALFSRSWIAVQVFQILVDLATILVAMALAAAVSRNASIVLLTGILLAVNPLMIVASVSILPETLSILLVTLVVILLITDPAGRRTSFALGALLAAAVYLKPSFLLMSVMLMCAYCVRTTWKIGKRNRRMAQAIAPLLIFGALLSPWAARNYMVMREFVPLTTSSGANLYGGNNPNADGGYASDDPYIVPGLSETESQARQKERAISWIRTNPKDFLNLLPLKAARFFWPLSMGTSGNMTLPGPLHSIVLTVVVAFYGCCLVGLASLIRSGRRWEALVFVAVPFGLLISTLIAFGSARFALPAHPEFTVLAALGLSSLARIPWGAAALRPTEEVHWLR